MQPKTRLTLRFINVLFWLAVWAAIIYWTEVWGRWIVMALQGVVPIMLWGFIHIALRDHTGE